MPLDFGGTGPGFTITLTGTSYIVERLSPRTYPSGVEPLKPMIHFLDPEPTQQTHNVNTTLYNVVRRLI